MARLYKVTKQRLFACVFHLTADVPFTRKDGQGLAVHLDVEYGGIGESFVIEGEFAVAFTVGEVADQNTISRVGTSTVFVEGVVGVVVVVPVTNETLLLFVVAFVATVVAAIAAGNKAQGHDDHCND